MNPSNPSLLDRLTGASGLPRLVFTLAVAAVLTLPLMIAAFAHGRPDPALAQGLWRLAIAPAIIVFVLLVHPWLKQRWLAAMAALRPLTGRTEAVEQGYAISRLGESTALALGAAFGVWISSTWHVAPLWLVIYTVGTQMLMFGLLALSIHDGLRRTRYLKQVVGAGLTLDLFDRQLLAPLARFGQSVSLTFVGGICLSLLFQSYETLKSPHSLVTYSILVVVALTLVVTSIWSIHTALVAAQARELATVRRHWQQARNELRRALNGSGGSGANVSTTEAAQRYDPLVVFGSYERQVLEASTWPFNPKIVKQLVASAAAPILIYGIKFAAGLSGSG